MEILHSYVMFIFSFELVQQIIHRRVIMGFTFWEAGGLLFANDILYIADTEFEL